MEGEPTKPQKPPVAAKGFLVKKRQIEKQIQKAAEAEKAGGSSARNSGNATSRYSTRWSENIDNISVESPKKLTSDDEVFQVDNDSSAQQTQTLDSTVDVRKRKNDFEAKAKAFRIESERDELIKQQNQEKRKKYLQERLRKRRHLAGPLHISPGAQPDNKHKVIEGQSLQSNVKQMNGSEVEELIPVLGEEPAPIPPQSSKEVLYSKIENTEFFEDLEEFATNVESENVTFVVLMKTLLISELTELERVRILFHWISSQDLNAIEFPDTVEEDSPYGHLKAIKEERSHYPTLFQRLCKAAGIHCKKVNGFVKGVGYFPDHSFSANPEEHRGMWNAVYIHGNWRLIDTHWGARSIDELDRKTLTYRYEEHYFLTDPDVLINTHFPDEEPWQLLHKPLKLCEFEKTVRHWPLYYDLNLNEISHHCGLIEVDRSGFVQVKLRVPQAVRNNYDFNFKLQPKSEDRLVDKTLNEHVLHHQSSTEETFDVHLTTLGQYILTFFGHIAEGKLDRTMLSRYQLNLATDVNKNVKMMSPPFPSAWPCYGPTGIISKLGLMAISHNCPTVECDSNGEAEISFSIDNKNSDVKFMQELKDKDEIQKNRAIHYIEQGIVYFLVKVNEKGKFKLTLFAKAENGASYSWFCHYLVFSDKQLSGTHNNCFPDIPNGRLGPLQPDFTDLGLVRVDPLTALEETSVYIDSDQQEMCQITFRHSGPLSMSAHLYSLKERLDDSNVMIAKDKQYSTVFVNLPINDMAKTFALRLYTAKPEAKELAFVYTALIRLPKSNIASPKSFYKGSWGLNGKLFYGSGCTSVAFDNVNAVYKHVPNAETLPCRSYSGGGDMRMILSHQEAMQMSSKVLKLLESEKVEIDQSALVTSNQANKTTLFVRFPDVGMYSVALYGKKINESTDGLPHLYSCLVEVRKASDCQKQFPSSYKIYEQSSVELYSPLNSQLPTNTTVKFKIAIGQFQKGAVTPFAKVRLLEDNNRYISPNKENGCQYEWNYTAVPGSKTVSLMVQQKTNEKTMNYVLKYDIDS